MNYIDAAFAPLRKTGQIKLYGPEAFAGMRKAGRLVAECLDQLADIVKPGLPTEAIDTFVFDFAMDHGARPATLMYRGYNKSTCTSINHVVCHGIPNEKPLKEGDIVNIDVTLILDGWHGDSSRMYPIGEIPRKAERLIEVTYEAMMRGIAAVKPGRTTGDIGAAIQTFVEPQHMSVVRDFCGHGLGRLFHDEPNIVHVGRAGEGVVLKPGMLFTIEPMINLGRAHVKVLSDGWTAVTRDRSLSAQFEHTVGRDQRRLRGVHDLAGRAPQATIRLNLRHRAPIAKRRSSRHAACMPPKPDPAEPLWPKPPHYHGHRERLRARFMEAGAEALADYEMLELVLFRALPRRDVKPLAKELLAKFGSFAEVISAPRAASRGSRGPWRGGDRRIQDRAGCGAPARQGAGDEAARRCRHGPR